jgi:hypothetical protein
MMSTISLVRLLWGKDKTRAGLQFPAVCEGEIITLASKFTLVQDYEIIAIL